MLSGGRGHILWVLGALRGSTHPNLYLQENNFATLSDRDTLFPFFLLVVVPVSPVSPVMPTHLDQLPDDPRTKYQVVGGATYSGS